MKQRCKRRAGQHTKALLFPSFSCSLYSHSPPALFRPPVTVRVSLAAVALVNPVICWGCAVQTCVAASLYHFTKLTLTRLLFEEPWSTLCGSGERGGGSGWWVTRLEGVLTGFLDA